MKKWLKIPLLVLFGIGLLPVSTVSQNPQLDLQLIDVVIEPVPEQRAPNVLDLYTSRSYRVTVTIQKSQTLPPGTSFFVSAECINAQQNIVSIGHARVGESSGWFIYACFDIYPGQASPGQWSFNIAVDAHNEIPETDENNNYWGRSVNIY
jgi:hypothetical protein